MAKKRSPFNALFAIAAGILLSIGTGAQLVSPPAAAAREDAAVLSISKLVAGAQGIGNFQVSPDARKLAWRTVEGPRVKLNFRDLHTGKTIGIDARPGNFSWAADSQTLLLLADQGGNENYHVFAMNTAAGGAQAVDLTPGEFINAVLVQLSPKNREEIFVKHNRRDVARFDLYRINIKTGTEQLVEENPGNVVNWLIDGTGAVKCRIVQTGARRELQLNRGASAPRWTSLITWDIAETVIPLRFTAGNDALWLESNRNRNLISLTKLSFASGRESLIYADAKADLDTEGNSVQIGPKSMLPMLAISEPGYPNVHIFNRQLARAAARYLSGGPARLSITSVSDNERLATILVYDGFGTRSYLLDITSGHSELLGEDYFSAIRSQIQPVQPISFTSRDGLDLSGFLTLPATYKPGSRIPLVVRVHGGPWYRNIWGNTDFWPAAAQVQFLASRGYGVLEINYRGSSGFGRRFMEAAVGEFGMAMQDDLVDGVNWAIARGIAMPQKVAVLGSSYGGYAALMALSSGTPTFACGVAMSAPTDLAKLIESFPPYWDLEMNLWYRFVGRPSDPKDRVNMDSRSPISRANQITAPMLLLHGENDPRVPVSQAAAFAAALKNAGKAVDFIVFPGEGHFFSGYATATRTYQKLAEFLGTCLLDEAKP